MRRSGKLRLKRLSSALFMSFYHAGSPQTRLRLKAEIERARMKSVHSGRSRPEVKEIIKRRAREQWKIDPQLIDKPNKTAEIIRGEVVRDVNKLSDVPPEWAVEDPDHPTEKDITKAVDRIRRQIERTQQSDK